MQPGLNPLLVCVCYTFLQKYLFFVNKCKSVLFYAIYLQFSSFILLINLSSVNTNLQKTKFLIGISLNKFQDLWWLCAGNARIKLSLYKYTFARFEKYCIKNNSLILSKNGAPFKIAIADVKAGKKLLANGNLYIIELDESKADPQNRYPWPHGTEKCPAAAYSLCDLHWSQRYLQLPV